MVEAREALAEVERLVGDPGDQQVAEGVVAAGVVAQVDQQIGGVRGAWDHGFKLLVG